MTEQKNLSPQSQQAGLRQADDEALLRWRKRNSYYYGWLEKIYKFVVRPNSRVLHVGCQCGDLLAAVKPAYGVGIDTDPQAVELARKRFPHLKFCSGPA